MATTSSSANTLCTIGAYSLTYIGKDIVIDPTTGIITVDTESAMSQ